MPNTPRQRQPADAFTRVVSTAVEYGVAKVSRTADTWTQNLTTGAGEAGAPHEPDPGRHPRGDNPVWGAIKGAWSGSSATVKAAIVTAMVSLVLLVFLLGLLVVAAVTKVPRAKT